MTTPADAGGWSASSSRNLPPRRRDPARERDLRLQRTYGITSAQYDEILAHQQGGCAVCGRTPEAGKNLNVDHDHKTGLLRGLLCWRCNRRVVADHRDPDGTFLLRRAAQYLELPPAVEVVGEVFGRKGRITNKRRRKSTRKKRT